MKRNPALWVKLCFAFASLSLFLTQTQALTEHQIWINEFHYDNAGTDKDEFVEIAAKESIDLTGLVLTVYNGLGGGVTASRTITSKDMGTVSNGIRLVVFYISGIQNGAPDGLAISLGSFSQFLSYEGSFMATEGPLSGQKSVDIGISESGSTPLGHSLQLVGQGSKYSQFTWSKAQPQTPGSVNRGQSFSVPDFGTTSTLFAIGIFALLSAKRKYSSI